MEDVTHLIERPSPFTPEETSELIETAACLLEQQLVENPMMFIYPVFPYPLVYDIMDLLRDHVQQVYVNENVDVELLEIIDMALNLLYNCVAPARSQPSTQLCMVDVDVDVDVDAITAKIDALRAIPQPDQRTTEWYEFRYRYLTASSIWKAFFSESSRNQLICDKCKPLDAGKYTAGGQSIESPMHWGHKYEPLSIKIYEERFQTQVSDFGCLPHPCIHFLAASPDGINTSVLSPLYGRMLEVKTIVKRDIDGIPKLEYWIQMQLQMEVCDLDESDFLETRFKEYADYDEFLLDSLVQYDRSKLNEQKGQIVLFMKEGQQPFYVYAPFAVMHDKESALAWEEQIMHDYNDLTWVKNIYWRLDQLSCVLVKRNRLWFTAALPILEQLWADIQHDKINGYEHRLPTKNKRSATATLNVDTDGNSFEEETVKRCLIDVEDL